MTERPPGADCQRWNHHVSKARDHVAACDFGVDTKGRVHSAGFRCLGWAYDVSSDLLGRPSYGRSGIVLFRGSHANRGTSRPKDRGSNERGVESVESPSAIRVPLASLRQCHVITRHCCYQTRIFENAAVMQVSPCVLKILLCEQFCSRWRFGA